MEGAAVAPLPASRTPGAPYRAPSASAPGGTVSESPLRFHTTHGGKHPCHSPAAPAWTFSPPSSVSRSGSKRPWCRCHVWIRRRTRIPSHGAGHSGKCSRGNRQLPGRGRLLHLAPPPPPPPCYQGCKVSALRSTWFCSISIMHTINYTTG